MTARIIDGPCDRTRYLREACQCDRCHDWDTLRINMTVEGPLAVAGIIAALYAWQHERTLIRLAPAMAKTETNIGGCQTLTRALTDHVG